MQKQSSSTAIIRPFLADAVFALVFTTFCGLGLASFAATVGFSMTAAIVMLVVMWVIGMALTWIVPHIWAPTALHRTIYGGVLAALLGLLGWYEAAHYQSPPTTAEIIEGVSQRVISLMPAPPRTARPRAVAAETYHGCVSGVFTVCGGQDVHMSDIRIDKFRGPAVALTNAKDVDIRRTVFGTNEPEDKLWRFSDLNAAIINVGTTALLLITLLVGGASYYYLRLRQSHRSIVPTSVVRNEGKVGTMTGKIVEEGYDHAIHITESGSVETLEADISAKKQAD